MSYDVITIDTCIFQSNGFEFSNGILAQLDQFKEGSAEFVISEIIYNELLKHISENIQKAKSRFQNVVTDGPKNALLNDEQIATLKAVYDATSTPEEAAKQKLHAFMKKTGCKVVPAKDFDVQKLIDGYFKVEPPFEDTANKKHEFPDAIALLSLEKWATKHSKKILVITDDGGWAKYCSTSTQIDTSKDLPVALSLFQQRAAETATAINALLALIDSDEGAPVLLEQFEDRLTDALGDLQPDGDGNSYADVDCDDVTLQLEEFEFISSASDYGVTLVKTGVKKVVFRIKISATAHASGTFNLSVYDSIDKDRVSLGSLNAEKKVTQKIEVLVEIEGDLDSKTPNEDIEITNVEVLKGFEEINFGHIEPPSYEE